MDEKNPSRVKNSVILGISILTGVVGLIIVLGALFLGWHFGKGQEQYGIIVVCFVTASAPVSLAVMTAVGLGTLRFLSKQNEASGETNSNEEDIT